MKPTRWKHNCVTYTNNLLFYFLVWKIFFVWKIFCLEDLFVQENLHSDSEHDNRTTPILPTKIMQAKETSKSAHSKPHSNYKRR